MGRGRILLTAAVALFVASGAAAAKPSLGASDVASSAAKPPAAPPQERGPAPAPGPSAAALVAALAAAEQGLAAAAQAIVAGGAAMATGLAGALGALAVALATLAAALAALLGGAGQAVARDPRLLAPVGAAGLACGLAWLARAGKLAPLAALYSRLAPRELLANDARRRIVEFVQGRPGAHLSQIREATGLGWGSTVYHLQRLRDAHLLSARRVGNQLCHFVNGAQAPEEQRALAALKQAKAHAIVEYLAFRGPSTQRRLAEELGMSSALVSWHAKRLESLGVVERVRTGRTTTLTLRAAPPRAALPAPAAPPVPAAA